MTKGNLDLETFPKSDWNRQFNNYTLPENCALGDTVKGILAK